MGDSWPTIMITALLSSGGAAFFISVARGWNTLRQGAKARARETIVDLAQDRDRAVESERTALADARYWQDIAGKYRFQLNTAGLRPNPEDPIPPSDVQAREARLGK